MKKLTILLSIVLLNTCSFAAYSDSRIHSHSHSLKDLASAWNANSTMHLQQPSHDMQIVYGGEDISRKPALA